MCVLCAQILLPETEACNDPLPPAECLQCFTVLSETMWVLRVYVGIYPRCGRLLTMYLHDRLEVPESPPASPSDFVRFSGSDPPFLHICNSDVTQNSDREDPHVIAHIHYCKAKRQRPIEHELALLGNDLIVPKTQSPSLCLRSGTASDPQ